VAFVLAALADHVTTLFSQNAAPVRLARVDLMAELLTDLRAETASFEALLHPCGTATGSGPRRPRGGRSATR
jgi:hypothetical protein